ncbi:MAG: hypothetical protein LBH25_04650 [Fibromonadaceae bacterium]|jgi:hypothetical protein|nr:hypothetical protein [Fibromonadaceae bacterium]
MADCSSYPACVSLSDIPRGTCCIANAGTPILYRTADAGLDYCFGYPPVPGSVCDDGTWEHILQPPLPSSGSALLPSSGSSGGGIEIPVSDGGMELFFYAVLAVFFLGSFFAGISFGGRI